VDFNTHGTFMPTHRVGRRRVGWYATADASRVDAARGSPGWMDGWMDARANPPTTVGWCAPADVSTGDDGDAGNETKRNTRARWGGVRPSGSVARRDDARRDRRALSGKKRCLWLDVGKKYSRAKRLTSDATTRGSIECAQGSDREFRERF